LFNDQFVRVLRTIVLPSTVGDHCFHTIYYLPVERRVIQDIHVMLRRMDGKAPKFATVPIIETEDGKSGKSGKSTRVDDALATPLALTVEKKVDDKTLKAALAGVLSGAGDKVLVGPGDKATVDDVPTKTVLHFRRRV
jgi:hypothetical protein